MPLRTSTHDSGPSWVASPSMSDSFIPFSMPVYPGALALRPPHPRPFRPAASRPSRSTTSPPDPPRIDLTRFTEATRRAIWDVLAASCFGATAEEAREAEAAGDWVEVHTAEEAGLVVFYCLGPLARRLARAGRAGGRAGAVPLRRGEPARGSGPAGRARAVGGVGRGGRGRRAGWMRPPPAACSANDRVARRRLRPPLATGANLGQLGEARRGQIGARLAAPRPPIAQEIPLPPKRCRANHCDGRCTGTSGRRKR